MVQKGPLEWCGAWGGFLGNRPPSPQDGSEDTSASVMQKTPIILSKPPAERVSREDSSEGEAGSS